MQVATLTFNPFQENTYVIYDDVGNTMIVDPGCYDPAEQQLLVKYLEDHKLTPRLLVNTHCHIDHIFGNAFVSRTFDLPLHAHVGEQIVLDQQSVVAGMYGMQLDPSPNISVALQPDTMLKLGESFAKILFTPGHSPASICLYFKEEAILVGGDVLFQGSIGRTDLPGGDYATLIHSIETQLFSLPDDVKVFPGHGPSTNIGFEKMTNPFFR